MQGNDSDDKGCFSISICHISSAMIVVEYMFYFNTNSEIRASIPVSPCIPTNEFDGSTAILGNEIQRQTVSKN